MEPKKKGDGLMIRKITDDAPRFAMLPGEEVVEISKHWYYQLLNCVPPLRYEAGGFFVGEEANFVEYQGEMYYGYTFCFTHCGSYYATSPKTPVSGSNVKLINDAVRVINRLNHSLQRDFAKYVERIIDLGYQVYIPNTGCDIKCGYIRKGDKACGMEYKFGEGLFLCTEVHPSKKFGCGTLISKERYNRGHGLQGFLLDDIDEDLIDRVMSYFAYSSWEEFVEDRGLNVIEYKFNN